jgi:hypothetical protein
LLDLERQVLALEKAKVPAGEFDVYKIVARGEACGAPEQIYLIDYELH